jgi:ABC-type lipoprotein release transport system permease subunit
MFGPRHLVRRMLRQPLITASIVCGVALAVALGVATPLATDLLAALGLRATVGALPPVSQNIQLARTTQGFTDAYRERVTRELGGLVAGTYGVSYTPSLAARREPDLSFVARLRSQEQIADHIEVTGRAPRSLANRDTSIGRPECDGDRVVEAMISAQQAPLFGFAVGDRVCIDDELPVEIVGTWEPRDIAAGYWFGDERPLTGELTGGAGNNERVAVLMIDPGDWNTVARFVPKEQTSYVLRMTVQPEAMTLPTLRTVDENLRTFRTQVASLQPRTTLLTGLDAAIATYSQRFRLLQSALVTLLVAMVMLAIVYIILVGALATEQQSAEIAVLRSRGASSVQIMLAQIAQAWALVVPGLALGVALGLGAVGALRRTDLFMRLRGQGTLELRWTTPVLVIVAAIVVAVVAGLVWAAWPALRQSLVTLRQERARPPRRSGWRRAQVDLVIVFGAVLGWWQLRRYGGGLVTTVDGSAQFNILTLAAPVLMLAAGAVLFLRVFPFVARALGTMFGGGRGVVAALSAWQLGRNPLLYGRLVLLLILTVGLGIYSQTVSATIAREQLRQSVVDAGADVRVELDPDDDPALIATQYRSRSTTTLARLRTEVLEKTAISERQIGTATLLAVNGSELATVLEQSGSTDQTLLSTLRRVSAGNNLPLGLALPAGTRAVRVGVRGVATNLVVYAKIADGDGTTLLELGPPTEEWQTLQAPLPPDVREPATLQSLLAVAPQGTFGSARPGLFLRQLEAVVGDTPTLLHSFEDVDQWEGISTGVGRVNIAREPAAAGETVPVARMSFGSISASAPAVVRFRIDAPLPVWSYRPGAGVSANPGEALTLRVDDAIIAARVGERIGRIPGVDTVGQTVLVADRRRANDILAYGLPNPIAPTELRLSLEPGASDRPAERSGNTAYTKAGALLVRSSDPLSNGVRVVLLLGFGAAVVLSVVGFLTYAALTIRAREIEWSVLRALGIPSRDLVLLVAAEQGFVLLSGVVAGLIVGVVLTLTTTPFLQVIAQSAALRQASVDWAGLGLIAGALTIALAIALAALLVAVGRRSLTQELRMGEA